MRLFPAFFLLLAVSFVSVATMAQGKSKTYFSTINENGDPVQPDNATYLQVLTERNDTTWEFSYYKYDGPRIYMKTYRDKNMTMEHGHSAYYDDKGRIDSSGHIFNGRKEQYWHYYTDSLTIYQTAFYQDGQLVYNKDKNQLDEEGTNSDTLVGFTRVESEAQFKKGVDGWTKYLQKNITIPKRFETLGHAGQVRVRFVVEKNGKVDDTQILVSLEYSADEEALRIIRNSPAWTPAMQNGKTVKAFRIQPFTFGK
jgi:protein TonB